MIEKIKTFYGKVGRYIGAMQIAPTKAQMQVCLLLVGLFLLTVGTGIDSALAYGVDSTEIETDRIDKAIGKLMKAITGPFGALICIVAGLFAIVMAAMGNYKVAMSLLVISLGAFILKSIVKTFFFTPNTIEETAQYGG